MRKHGEGLCVGEGVPPQPLGRRKSSYGNFPGEVLLWIWNYAGAAQRLGCGAHLFVCVAAEHQQSASANSDGQTECDAILNESYTLFGAAQTGEKVLDIEFLVMVL